MSDISIGARRLAYTVEEFAAGTGLGRTRIYAAIKEKKLRAKKFGARTIITDEDGRAFLAALPDMAAA